jgi:hypothetical protein
MKILKPVLLLIGGIILLVLFIGIFMKKDHKNVRISSMPQAKKYLSS